MAGYDNLELIERMKLDCVLGQYRPGDFVGGCLPGVRVFFEELCLDENGQPLHGAERESGSQWIVCIALVEGVFVHYDVHAGMLSGDEILASLRQLQARCSDSARALTFMGDTLRRRQRRISALEQRLGRVESIIATARRLRAGETLDRRFDLIWEEHRKLAAGEDPLEVVAWILEQGDAHGWGSTDGTLVDPLDEFRL